MGCFSGVISCFRSCFGYPARGSDRGSEPLLINNFHLLAKTLVLLLAYQQLCLVEKQKN